MKRTGDWHRWGRHTKGDTKGWSIDIGSAFRCSVSPTRPGSTDWHGSINGGHFGTYPDPAKAMRAIEREIESNVAKLNSDWQRVVNARAARKGHAPAADKAIPDASVELEATVDEALAVCDGDARAALRALLVANEYLEGEVGRMRELMSRVYALGEVSRQKGSGAGGPSLPAKMGAKSL